MKTKKLLFLLCILLLIVMAAACTTEMVTVSFYADGALYRQIRVEKGGYIDEFPPVPEKEGYKGVWSNEELNKINSDTRVDAIYTKSTYSVTFRVDGVVVETKVLDYGKIIADIPDVPEKEGYTGNWNISQDAFAFLTTDTIVDAVYEKIAVTVVFYKNAYDYSLASVRAGQPVEANKYYELQSDFVLTEDTEFVAGKSYYTRARQYYATLYAEDGALTSKIPDPPEEAGHSVKWMRIDSTPTGDVLSTPDFSNITGSFSVVAYPYVSVQLVDEQTERNATVSFEIGETVSEIVPPVTTLTNYKFFGWYTDDRYQNELSFPHVFTNNTTLYAKWIGLKPSEGVSIENGVVKSYSGSETNVYIPPEYVLANGQTVRVTSIGASAFKNSAIVSIDLPPTLTTIEESAFYGCASLIDVNFSYGNYVTVYGNSVFRGCVNLTSYRLNEKTTKLGSYAFYECEELTSISGIENSLLVEIERYTFYNCAKLTALTLPSGVKTIGEKAFSGATNANILFANASSVERVGDGAFENCKRFVGFFSENLREIGQNIFFGCSSLKSVTLFGNHKIGSLFGQSVPSDVESFYPITFDDRYSESDNTFEPLSQSATYYIPKTLFSVLITNPTDNVVQSDILFDCYTVKEVRFYGNIRKIASYAFRLENYSPSSLSFSVQFPSTLIEISPYAFCTRNDLAELTLPASLETIGAYAFSEISALKNVTISGNHLTFVGEHAFLDTPWYNNYQGIIGLGKVVLGVSENYCIKTTYYDVTPDQFSAYSVIAPYAFEGNRVLQKITLSESISQIGDNAFANCTGLRTFVFKAYVATSSRRIGATILDGCTALVDLTVCEDIDITTLFSGGVPSSLRILRLSYSQRDSVLSVAGTAGFGTGSITSTSIATLEIGDGFTEIEDNAFTSTTSLVGLTISSTITSIGTRAFYGCTGLSSVTIQGTALTSIAEESFDGCTSLKTFTFPSSLVSIGARAFRSSALTSFTAPERLRTIGKSAFDGSSSLATVTLNSTITGIGNYAFRGCNLKAISLPSTLQFLTPDNVFLGAGMLDNNTGFEKLTLYVGVSVRELFGTTIPGSFNTAIVERGSVIDGEFSGMSTLRTITLQKGVTSIGDNAFTDCTSLQRIVIPSSVSSIGEYAFMNCSNLATCQIDTDGSRLTTLKKGIFKDCRELKYVVFPGSVTTGDWTDMFSGCVKLASSNLPTAVTSVGNYAYYDCKNLSLLRLHDGIVSIGTSAFYNCYLLELDDVDFGSVTYIGASAFENCRKLDSIRAEKATFIGANAYDGCTVLKELTSGNEPVSSVADSTVRANVTILNVAENVGAVDPSDYLAGCTSLVSVVVYSTQSTFPADDFVAEVASISANKAISFLSVEQYGSVAVNTPNVYRKPSNQDFTFEYDDITMTATITGTSSAITESYIYLPDTTTKEDKTYTITAIGSSAFLNQTFTYVVIPSGIKTIGNAAFSKSKLKTVVFESGSRCEIIDGNAFKESEISTISIPSSVITIGNAAFEGCVYLENVNFFAGSQLQTIGDYAFNNDSLLETITFTGPISYVGASSFAGSGITSIDFGAQATFTTVSNNMFRATHLASIVLPSTVTSIEQGAFYGYSGSTFVCPENLVSIGDQAFYSATILSSVTFSSALISIGNEAFYGCTLLSHIVLPDTLVSVGNSCFLNCTNVISLTIGEGIKTVGNSAFSGLVSLREITYKAIDMDDLPVQNGVFGTAGMSASGIVFNVDSCVKSLPSNLFYPSSSVTERPCLASVAFSGTPSLEKMGDSLFRNCNTLSSIVIPATVLHIGSHAFYGCESITIRSQSAKQGADWKSDYKNSDKAVTFGVSNNTSGDFSYVIYEDGVILTAYSGTDIVTVPRTIGGKPVLGTGVTFEQQSVRYVELPDTIVNLGSFYGCTSLVGISLHEGVEEIGEKAFYGCSSLIYFDLPASIATIGEGAFENCSSLNVVYLSSQAIKDKFVSENLSQTCGQLFAEADIIYLSTALSEDNMSGVYAADGSATYTRILSGRNGYNIYSVLYWKTSSTTSGSYVYLLNDWDTSSDPDDIATRYNLYVDGIGTMRDYEVKSIVPWRAYSSDIATITIGRSITSISKYAFNEMNNVKTVYYEAENCPGSGESKYIFSTSDPSGEGFDVIFGLHVTVIPNYLFYNCKNLKNVVWSGDKVTSIGEYAFSGCTGLISVVIPDCVVTIKSHAYTGCLNVTSLTLGKNIKTFGTEAFSEFGVDENGFYLQSIYYNVLSADEAPINVFNTRYNLGSDDTGTSLFVHKEVSILPDNMFYGFNRLVYVRFAGDAFLSAIGDYAFYACENLPMISIPLSVNSLGKYSFAGCSELSNISFADNCRVRFIGERAFYDTGYYNLNSGSITNWIDGVLYLNDRKFLLEARQTVAEDYAVLETTDVIAEKAFLSISGLKYISIPSSVDIICTDAFVGCYNLKTLYLTSTAVISGLSSVDSQGNIGQYATVIYCRADLMKNNKTIAGLYVAENYVCVETETMKNNYQYYSYTNLYWQTALSGTDSTVYTYLLNDFDNPGYYRMEIAGDGKMCDYASAEVTPWHNAKGVDYSSLVTQITLSRNVASIGNYAFSGFTNLSTVLYRNSEALSTIGDHAFAGCSMLAIIDIEKSVQSIGSYAFANCVSVTSIRYKATNCADLAAQNNVFRSVGSLATGIIVEIGLDVERVPAYFADPGNDEDIAPYIKQVRFSGGENNNCQSIGQYAFAFCSEMESLSCEGFRMKNIENHAFYTCKKLVSISIPSKVQTIGSYAFANTYKVASIILKAADCTVGDAIFENAGTEVSVGLMVSFAETVESVPAKFLYHVSTVRNVYFPGDEEGNCNSIGELAFCGCVRLTSVVIPQTVESIGAGAFFGCTSLASFTVPFVGGAAKAIAASPTTLFGYVFHSSTEQITTGMTAVRQYYSTGVTTEYYIPDSLTNVTITRYTNLYYGAFSNCKNIVSVTINLSSIGSIRDEAASANVVNGYLIGERAFYECDALATVSMTSILTEIGKEAFFGCDNLSVITIPENVTTLGDLAFGNCKGVRTVRFNAKNCVNLQSDTTVFKGLGRNQSSVIIEIGSAVTNIPDYLFCSASGASEDDIPNVTDLRFSNLNSSALKRIGVQAFKNCTALGAVSLPPTLTSICVDAFYGTSFYSVGWRGALKYYEGNSYYFVLAFDEAKGSSTSTCSLLDGTTLIADSAFMGSVMLQTVIFPSSIAYIGESAFQNCDNLKTFAFNKNENGESSLVSIGAKAFQGCTSIFEFYIPSKVTVIGEDAFVGCNSLKKVKIDSATICKLIVTETAVGNLCKEATTIDLNEKINNDSIGTLIKSKFTYKEIVEEIYKRYEKR